MIELMILGALIGSSSTLLVIDAKKERPSEGNERSSSV